MTYDSGNYEAATARAIELFGYEELRAEQQAPARQQRPGAARHRRLDLHRDVRPGPLARARRRSATARAAGSTPASGCSPTGKVEVHHRRHRRTGRATRRRGARSSPTGSASPFENVEVLHGDTQIAPKGLDTYGSRSLVVGGEALVQAADKVIEKAKPIAAHLLEASADDLEFSGGRFSVKGTDKGVAIAEVALADVRPAHNLPDGVEPSLDADATYDPVNFSFPHGTHLCAMEVDTETGATTMRKYVCRRRHRQDHQPAHRRGPGARRPRAGHRAGAVGGSGVRRAGHPGHRLVRRLHPADGRRHDQLRHRPHRRPRRRRTRSAPRASARPAPSPRPRRSSTPSSMPCATSASTTSRCRAPPSGCGRRSSPPGRTPAT